MYSTADQEPEDRLERVRASWPRVLEPVRLGEETIPLLGGSASPTLTRVVNGERSVSSSRALALLRLPADAPVGGHPTRYLGVIMMVGEESPSAFSSHISSLVPGELEAVEPDRGLDIYVEKGETTMAHHVAVRQSASGWLTGPFEVAGVPAEGGTAQAVLVGVGWQLPEQMMMRVAEDFIEYLDGFREEFL